MTDFYFSAAGNDNTGNGTIGNPYRSIAKANQVADGGDMLLFNGGDTFVGLLEVAANCSYTSYGTGKAIIQNGDDNAIKLENKAGVSIFTLILDGVDELTNDHHGLWGLNSSVLAGQLANVTVFDVEVRQFGHNGIMFEATNYPSGFHNLIIDSCNVHDCTAGHNASAGTAGIRVGSESIWGSVDHGFLMTTVTVTNNNVKDCRGKAGAPQHTGNGILLSQCSVFLMEGNTSDNCGENSNSQAGPVGIWCWDSVDGAIRGNVAKHQKSAGPDGAGFDIDGGCQRVVMEYNFAFECAGPGLLIYSFPDQPGNRMLQMRDCTARYNLSVRCGLTSASKYGAFIGSNRRDTGDMQNIHFYNNTVVTDDMNGHQPDCFQIWTYQGVTADHFTGIVANNVFLQLGKGLTCDMRKTQMTIMNNVYYCPTGNKMRVYGFDYFLPDTWIGALEDLGQPTEQLRGQVMAVWDDPLFVNPNGSTIADFVPQAGSTVWALGLDLQQEYGLPFPTRDLQGNVIAATEKLFTCGAIQSAFPANQFASPNDISAAPWTQFPAATADVDSGLAGVSANTAQRYRNKAGVTLSELGVQQAYAASLKTFRRGAFFKSDGVSNVIFGNYGPAHDFTDYWHMWLDLAAGSVNGIEAFGWLLDNVDNIRVTKRANGYWLITYDVTVNAAWTSDYPGFMGSDPHDAYGYAGDGVRGILVDGLFQYQLS